jgi:hypothetical protein
VFPILYNIALICCNFDISIEDDTYYGSRTDSKQNLYPAQHICFLEYVSAWMDFLPGRFPARSLLQHEVNSL